MVVNTLTHSGPVFTNIFDPVNGLKLSLIMRSSSTLVFTNMVVVT